MRSLNLTLPTLEANLALDDVLLHVAEEGQTAVEILRFWEYPAHAAVLGSACRAGEDVLLDACRRDAVPLARRTTGGGTVLIGPGCLNVAIVLRYDRSPALNTIQGTFAYVLERIQQVLRQLCGERGVRCDGTGDLCLGERKVGGSAQRRRRNAVLYHGTLLYRFDLTRVPLFLAEPERQPAYRRNRTHSDFLANVPVDPEDFKQRMIASWGADAALTSWPTDDVARLTATKLADPAWTFRR